MNTDNILAEKLLKIKAIKLQPSDPFTWASGWKSPFYCDNRKALSYPSLRSFVKIELSRIVAEKYPDAEVVAGVATGAIAQGALVADILGLPFVYVRSKAKDHGLGNLIEGNLEKGKKVVVVEDLISTGASSLKAVEAIRKAGCEVLGMVASYTYGFDVAAKAFADANVELSTITNYEAVVKTAISEGYILIAQLGEEKVKKAQEALAKMEITSDSASINAPMVGKVTFEITEREEPKLIKLEAKGLPTKACLWVQILPEGDNLCKMKVTSGIELNFLIKGMVEKYLEPGVKNIARVLASLPYDQL